MKTIRRWTTSLVTSFDSMISQVENHEALVNASIKEVQQAGARAKVQIGRVRQDGQQMRKRLLELRAQDEQWGERALRTATLDEQKALQCMKRKKRIEREISDLETQLVEHTRLEKQLSADLVLIDDKLIRLRQQRNLLRTRQSRAEALKTLQQDDSGIISEIDDIFERWEVKVAEYEATSSSTPFVADELEHEFAGDEEKDDLKQALQELQEKTKAA
jgi:phage shock protein A